MFREYSKQDIKKFETEIERLKAFKVGSRKSPCVFVERKNLRNPLYKKYSDRHEPQHLRPYSLALGIKMENSPKNKVV